MVYSIQDPDDPRNTLIRYYFFISFQRIREHECAMMIFTNVKIYVRTMVVWYTLFRTLMIHVIP